MELLGSLSVDGWLTLAVVAIATATMARDRLGPDLVMFGALSVLVVSGVLEPVRALQGFSNPALATIAVLFVCAAALRETGALTLISNAIFGSTTNPTVGLARLVWPTALMSGFMNNTPIVAMFIPMVRGYAERIGVSPSKFLIPLAYAAMFGGTCTAVGTSANLVVSGMLQESGYAPMRMFEIGHVGLPTTVVGLIYLLFVGRRMLPDRLDPSQSAHADAREYLVELEVARDSPLVDQTVEEAGLRQLPGLFLVEIRRPHGNVVRPVAPEDRIGPLDHLVFTGVASTVEDLVVRFPGLSAVDDVQLGGRGLFEVVVSHRSPLLGLTVKEANFRRRYDAAILAVHRAGVRLDEKIGEITLRPGDTLMLSASEGFRDAWQDSAAFYVVSAVSAEPPQRYQKANIALVTVLALVLIPAATNSEFLDAMLPPLLADFDVPLLVAAMGALVVLIVTGCVGLKGAREAVSWPVLVLIGSALGVANAMNDSGAATALGTALVEVTSALGPRATLTGVYVLGVVFASFISNAAAAALLFPVALTAAEVGGYDPRPFAMALAMAASAGFSTPIGSPANLLVYGPGGYRYRDFTRVGLPLNVIFLVIAVVLVPLVWSF